MLFPDAGVQIEQLQQNHKARKSCCASCTDSPPIMPDAVENTDQDAVIHRVKQARTCAENTAEIHKTFRKRNAQKLPVVQRHHIADRKQKTQKKKYKCHPVPAKPAPPALFLSYGPENHLQDK